jgi:hypothetical protein
MGKKSFPSPFFFEQQYTHHHSSGVKAGSSQPIIGKKKGVKSNSIM